MKATTLKQLKFVNWITTHDIKKVMSKSTYYNIVNWTTKPTKTIIEKMCVLLKIDEKEFNRLLKNTLKCSKEKLKKINNSRFQN